jgi:hypothetical protein
MPSPDSLATLRAIDAAFDLQVALLFKNLCDGLGNETAAAQTDAPMVSGCSLERFNRGLDVARNARRVARERFVGAEG